MAETIRSSTVHRATSSIKCGHYHHRAARHFFTGSTQLVPTSWSDSTVISRSRDRKQVQVVGWKFLQDLGLKKPAFLPDFGKEKRETVLKRFYGPIDRQTYDELLASDATIFEETDSPRLYKKSDWISLMCDVVQPAIPDYNWTAAVDGTKDDEGFCLVSVQATGHHTGQPFALPGMEPIPTSGQRFKLSEEIAKVKVVDGKIIQIKILPIKGAGPLAMYRALGGKIPSEATSA